ncbi:MAG TPA: ABC transporter substrate-binding protein [Aldersonia sp.]
MSPRTSQTPPRRRLAAVLLAGIAALWLVGCGSDSSGDSSGASETVTITHSQGETVIEGVPNNVVALSSQWADASLALGVTPVGYIDNVGMSSGGQSAPWETGLADSTKVDIQGDIVEQVAALNPDLILAPGFGADKSTLDKFSALAPTIPALSTAQVEKWEDQVAVLGEIYQKQDEAAQVVADLDGRIDGIAETNPGLQGKTFLYAFVASPTQIMVVADPNDGANALFTRLGMVLDPEIANSPGAATGRIALSPERVGDLDSDLLVVTSAAGLDDAFAQMAGYSTLPAVQNGGLVMLDIVTGVALNLPSPLSLPYALDQIEPELATVANQPA